jgi:hypothetical protein
LKKFEDCEKSGRLNLRCDPLPKVRDQFVSGVEQPAIPLVAKVMRIAFPPIFILDRKLVRMV